MPIETCSACGGVGWLGPSDRSPKDEAHIFQRCDACEKYTGDEEALVAFFNDKEASKGWLIYNIEIIYQP